MADNDKAALDKLMDQPVKTELLFEGKAKTKYLKTFLGNNRDLTNAPPEILEAIKIKIWTFCSNMIKSLILNIA